MPKSARTRADTLASAKSPSGSNPTARNRQRLQMADIARLAGVSVATVSRALNGSTEVSVATRERIGELARSMNYSINLSAKNLRLRQIRTVAVVIPFDRDARQHVSDPFFLTMLGSLADALTDRGFDMLLSRIDADNLEAAAKPYEAGLAIGVLLIGQWRHHDHLNRLAARGVPLVVWGAQLPQQIYCSVGSDNIAGGALATRHLLEQGRRRIVFLGDRDLPEVDLRYRGYAYQLEQHGRTVDPELVLKVPFDPSLARAAVSRLCERRVAFDAVFACSDVLAVAAIQSLRSNGLAVPKQIAVVGFDDVDWATHADPPLTTIRQSIVTAGIEMVDALTKLMAGEVVVPRTLNVELVVRQSSLR